MYLPYNLTVPLYCTFPSLSTSWFDNFPRLWSFSFLHQLWFRFSGQDHRQPPETSQEICRYIISFWFTFKQQNAHKNLNIQFFRALCSGGCRWKLRDRISLCQLNQNSRKVQNLKLVQEDLEAWKKQFIHIAGCKFAEVYTWQ